MNIKTITCHDVYNCGASLQAHALQKFLQQSGHHVEIIDYKPKYLSNHYQFGNVPQKYCLPLIRQLYLLAKWPGFKQSLKAKKLFDDFKDKYLKLTERRFSDFDSLKNSPPEADVYIAGSDQIWNPLFPNGKDPAFYLQFAPENATCASYAASIAADILNEEEQSLIKNLIGKIRHISVREKSAQTMLSQLGIGNVETVCDPVFLLPPSYWKELSEKSQLKPKKPYMLVYDFDCNPVIKQIAKYYSKKHHCDILLLSPKKLLYGTNISHQTGPLEFLYLILHSSFVLSNSFHGTAFSLLFRKDFCVVNRTERLNSRMSDLLQTFSLEGRLIHSLREFEQMPPIPWEEIQHISKHQIEHSKMVLDKILCHKN
jgi:hypothetical protein